MVEDCLIIGGGPAGLNAALVLGRAGRNVLLVDDNQPRNRVSRVANGFITRDGIDPVAFRQLAWQDISKYPSVRYVGARIVHVHKGQQFFTAVTADGSRIYARKLILATGISEVLPDIPDIQSFYGQSLFSCAYCDGWELRNRTLVIIGETGALFSLARSVYNWSHSLIVCSNGNAVLSDAQKELLLKKGIVVKEEKIQHMLGFAGQLHRVVFDDGSYADCNGGFVSVPWYQSARFGELLGCTMDEQGGFYTDALGRTSVAGIYAAGDSAEVSPAQLVIAAADGCRAAIGVNQDLSEEEFSLN